MLSLHGFWREWPEQVRDALPPVLAVLVLVGVVATGELEVGHPAERIDDVRRPDLGERFRPQRVLHYPQRHEVRPLLRRRDELLHRDVAAEVDDLVRGSADPSLVDRAARLHIESTVLDRLSRRIVTETTAK